MAGFSMYSERFIKQVVNEVQMGLITKEAARRKYHIKGHTTVLKWIRKFGNEKVYSVGMEPDDKISKTALLRRIKELEKQLEDEKLRSEGFSQMIDIAEKQFHIPIRKKSVTKRSRR
ncbi:hypothetical protein [Prolixibacter denitrificans]|jgi:transposase-like protein|uniref:Transposase n=1 Tax=Prolixibacter denitrificans TaxID=1541063 RepID=A0A2P8C550_9BACT|nr:hypothetical protein [Prolixibacter denitrificans]PSK80091.1 hypothetical protein CLV93_1352 [Prolixibacter denitrificans]GET21566.1 hypothetical protein JCM18694_18120 [Prolixibacter denitrificans]GET22046.1 hypothetical protein JCM18694_22920 [Prolixibacter denitrificans]GET22273.1 hypothetical protein JCM18694_25190 [Prolixibacter denitrificans]